MPETEYPQNDLIIAQLVKNSSLTDKQLATYLSYQSGLYKGKSGTYNRLGHPVAKGSFHRTLQQARNNVRKAIVTLILLGYLDITNTSDITYDITELFELGRRIRELKDVMAKNEGESANNKINELLSQVLRKLNSDIK